MIRKFLPSDDIAERLVSRDTHFSLFGGRVLDAAGFLVDSQWAGLKTFDDIVNSGNAIIVAEGGMGKSYVQRLFCDSQQNKVHVKLLELVTFVHDVQGLKEAVADACRNNEFLFLDGLDEAVGIAGELLRILQTCDGSAHVVIASRGIPQLNLLAEQLKWSMFSLLPYSREDVREQCGDKGVDFDSFMRKVERQNLGAVCSKPLGCKMLIALYRKTALNNSTTESLWRSLMEELCGENPDSKTREFIRDAKRVPVEDGFKIATIAALALKLSGHVFVARIADGKSDGRACNFSKVFTDEDSRDAFNTLLLRPLFVNVGKGCYRFAHSSYADFFAAQGVMEYLNEKEWGRIVFSPEGMPYPQWEGVIPWLAARNDEILENVKKSRPDLLLGTDALVDKIGAEEICQAILEHADKVSSSVRESPSVQSRYYALNTDKCAQVIRTILKTTTSDEVIDTGIDIISRARLESVADVLVDIFCDETRGRSLRISAGYTLCKLANNSQRRTCKKVLQGPMAEDLKGIVARMTWPDLMSVEELLSLLGSRNGQVMDAFSVWIENDGFVASLPRVTSKEKLRLLEWAISEIKRKEDVWDCLTDARRAVFLHCWKEERSPAFVPLLAKGLEGYAAIYRTPFENGDDEWNDSNHILSAQDYRNDAGRRREVAQFIVEHPQMPMDAVCGYWLSLLGPGDGDFVAASLEAATDPAIRERWATCLWHVGYVKLPEKAELWNKLHQEFPSVYRDDAAKTWEDMEKHSKELAERQCRFKRDQEKRGAENKDILSRNVVWAHKVLRSGNAKGKFPSLMAVIHQQWSHGEEKSFLDFRTSKIWPSFSEGEIRQLVESAYDFLKKSQGPWSNGRNVHPIYVQALCLLFDCGRDMLDKMPVKVWRKVAPELCWYVESGTFELLPLTVAHFKKTHPKIFWDVLSKYFREQLHSAPFWEIKMARQFLSDGEFVRLLRFLDEDGLPDHLKYALYGKFMEADYDLAAHYMKNKYVSVPLRSLGQWTIGCVLLAAPHRFPEFRKELSADATWGKHWAESLLAEETPHHARMARILPELSIRDLVEFYSWLNVQFPPEKAPHHEGVFTPGAMDNLYSFKSFVFNELMSRVEPEAISAIGELHRRFPAEKWFHDCALRLRNQLLETKCPAFSLEAICKLLASKKQMQVIQSADDLLDAIMDALDRYQIYLTGVDTPQGRFLWNEHNGIITHRKEEDFSDHLKGFLSKDLPRIVSNREVQLNRGRERKTGAKTDIWITAISDNTSELLELCIEVKGSWNSEVKTSYKTQLAGKYMDVGGADAGIFLVGWFEAEREEQKTCIDKQENIARLLEEQEQDLVGNGYKVKHVILDCSSCWPPVSAKKSHTQKEKE